MERAIVELKARWLLDDVDVVTAPVKTAAIVSASCPTGIRLLPAPVERQSAEDTVKERVHLRCR